MKEFTRYSAVMLGLMLTASSAMAAAKVVKVQLAGSKTASCVLKHGKYVPSGSSTAATRAACASLGVKKLSLSKIPSVEKLSATSGRAGAFISAVSGTPPTLRSLSTEDPTTIFWRPGVISSLIENNADETQCGELFLGSADGQSGGFASCYMAQNAGQSLSNIIQSQTSLCYMQGFPTAANLSAGAITVDSGSLPSGGITKLFDAPTGNTARIVKVIASIGDEGETLFLKIYSAGQNAAAGNAYRYDLWNCRDAESPATGYERTTIANSGKFVSTKMESSDEGTSASTVTAFIRQQGGRYSFNPLIDRSATIRHQSNEGGEFQSKVTIDASNKMLIKMLESHSTELARSYGITKFAGANIEDIAFSSGAFKRSSERTNEDAFTFQGAVEYRDSYYASAPSSSLLTELDAVNLSSDSFYASFSEINTDTSAFDCGATPTVAISLDMTGGNMPATIEACDGQRMDNMQFCFGEQLQSAIQNQTNSCGHP